MHELVEAVLPIRARLTEEDLTGLEREESAVKSDGLSVALHIKLLEVGREPEQGLGVRQHRARGVAEEGRVPKPEQA